MKKVSQISVIVFLGIFVVLSMGNPVNAVTYSSGFQVQNLSAAVANIQIKYLDQTGTQVFSKQTPSQPVRQKPTSPSMPLLLLTAP